MKSLALSLLVVALSALLISAQQPGRKQGSSDAPAAAAAAAVEPEKPFVAPCGLKQKLESNCNAKDEADKSVNFFDLFVMTILLKCETCYVNRH